MGDQFRTGDVQETQLIIRVDIINRSPIPVWVGMKYRSLFHGNTEVTYGRHTYRYPVKNTGKARLVSALQVDFKGKLKVDFSNVGVERV